VNEDERADRFIESHFDGLLWTTLTGSSYRFNLRVD